MTMIFGTEVKNYFKIQDAAVKVSSYDGDGRASKIDLLHRPHIESGGSLMPLNASFAIFAKIGDYLSFDMKMHCYLGYRYKLVNNSKKVISAKLTLPEPPDTHKRKETGKVIVTKSRDIFKSITHFDSVSTTTSDRDVEVVTAGKIEVTPYNYEKYPRNGGATDPNWTLTLSLTDIISYEWKGITYSTESPTDHLLHQITKIDGKKASIKESEKKTRYNVNIVHNTCDGGKKSISTFVIMTYKNEDELKDMMKFTVSPDKLD